jgi:hypothetical protein
MSENNIGKYVIKPIHLGVKMRKRKKGKIWKMKTEER